MLNEQQKHAVESTQGPLRIIAGVGTGKTFTLINRVDYLIKEKKIDPNKILLLTFTNKAAREIALRVEKIGHPSVQAMTFHSLAAKMLRKFWSNDFKILDSLQQEKLIKQILPDKKTNIKDTITSLDSIRLNRVLGVDPKNSDNKLEDLLNKYETALAEENALDFNGLLTALFKLWLLKPDILTQCQKMFARIMVDEYQDVNVIQIEILKKLAGSHKNLCVVGDEDQTIYSWRGSDPNSMKNFEKIFPETLSVTLVENYRNPRSILLGAEKLIKNNPDRIEKSLVAKSQNDSRIQLWECPNVAHRSEVLFHLLEKYIGSKSDMFEADELDTGDESFRNLSDIALLYRTQDQGKFLAKQLTKKGYPYQISNSEYFWQQSEITKFLDGISTFNKENGDISDSTEKNKFSDWVGKKVEIFIEANKLKETQNNRLRHLLPYAIQFDSFGFDEALQAFFDDIKTQQDADNLVYADRINLLTLHASKGLEFPIVVIFGLEEGKIPLAKSPLDEERRLLYVGMTRAKEELHLIYTSKISGKKSERSRFLVEIGLENIDLAKLPEKQTTKLRRMELKRAQLTLF